MAEESDTEAYLVKRVKETGGHQRKLAWIGRRGAPDRFIWWDGPIFAFVELKATGKSASALQKAEHARLQASGFEVYVVHSKAAVDTLISRLTSRLN